MGKTDEKAYRQLVEEYSDMVTRICLVHTGNFADAEDCYQNVFFSLFKEMGKTDIPNPKAWIIRVALNECRSILRYRLRKNTVRLYDLMEVCRDENEWEMLDLIFRLPPKQRDAVYLYYYEEQSVEQIAQAMKSKPNTVKSWLKRGRDRLKNLLDE